MIFKVVLVFLVAAALGCHPRCRRRKRQVSYYSPSLENYFSSCLRPHEGNLDISTVVGYTIEETNWFRMSDQFCSSDTVLCWQGILSRYLISSSELFQPTLNCIQQYGYDRNRRRGKSSREKLAYGRRRRDAGVESPLGGSSTKIFEERLSSALSSYGLDAPTLIEFFKSYVICSSATCNCEGINLAPDEICGRNWYTRIAAMTRVGSSLRYGLVSKTNEAISEVEQLRKDHVERLLSENR